MSEKSSAEEKELEDKVEDGLDIEDSLLEPAIQLSTDDNGLEQTEDSLLEPAIQLSTDDNGSEQTEDQFFPFDNLSVEINEGEEENTSSKESSEQQSTIFEENSFNESVENGQELSNAIENAVADSTVPESNESSREATFEERNVIKTEESEEYPATNLSDYLFSETSMNYDEGSNSASEETKEETKKYQLYRFGKIMKNVQMAEYETLQVLYQLLYQRSAWDTQEILKQRILEFSGFNFNNSSEEYFNRDMMLKTQPNEVLVKIGHVLGLDQIRSMYGGGDNARLDLISAIMQFLTTMKSLNSRSRRRGPYVKSGMVSIDIAPKNLQTKCGCLNRCLQKVTKAQRAALLEYLKELEEKQLLDSYIYNLIEAKKNVRRPGEEKQKYREIKYEYKAKFGPKEFTVCKGGFAVFHGLKQSKLLQIQNNIKNETGFPAKIDMKDFPLFNVPESHRRSNPRTDTAAIYTPEESSSRRNSAQSEDELKEMTNKVVPKLIVEKLQTNDAENNKYKVPELDDIYKISSIEEEEAASEKTKLKEFPLVVTALNNASKELLIDVHFLLFLDSADDEEIKNNILDFNGFTFDTDTEEYDERNEFLQRMSFKIVSDVARSFSLEILNSKEETIKNILGFLQKPAESYLRISSNVPLSLSDVELDDIDGFSDSDESITCEVVEKKVECIDLISSGEDSDDEKPNKVRSPKKAVVPNPKQPSTQPTPTSSLSTPAPSKPSPSIPSPSIPSPSVASVVTNIPSAAPTQSMDTDSSSDSQSGNRTLRNFETICKIVNTHPHEYLVDIFDLLYLKKHEPSTLRKDILDFSGFTFEKGSAEYVKRKQLLDRMLYNSVRRIYNTLIHNTTEVKVFSKPTMIAEIFQFLFKLPDHDTSVRPAPSTKPAAKPVVPAVGKSAPVGIAPPPGIPAINQNGKLSDLKRVFQRVACFPCEYLIDVHKLLFMTDCDPKVIRQNIFAFKGFKFGPESQEFQQRKMYLEYLTFHSLRKISSVLTTRSVDLRNSTKHELATHLTQVLAEYCNTFTDAEVPEINATNQTTPSSTVTSSSSKAVESIVVTPTLDPSLANPPAETPTSSTVQSKSTPSGQKSAPSKSKNVTPSKTQPAASPLPISIVDARSVPQTKRKRKSNTVSKIITEKSQPDLNQFADINLPEVEKYRQLYGQSIYNPNLPTITGITTFSATGIPQTFPMAQPMSFPIMQVQPSQVIGVPVISQVQSTPGEVIVPGENASTDEDRPSKKQKASEKSEKRGDANDDEEDCDKPLASLIGHPIDSVLEKNISDIVEQTDLQDITINKVIQKIYSMYPKFDLSYRKEFIKSTVRNLLYKLGEKNNSNVPSGDRNTNSPDCSVTTTDIQDNSMDESSEASAKS
ncbi:uro-adherence factor A isoform X9 [Parasteatoda tepidariorum]|uniref:uro-adherence factor A isoform X9 n=1 Tax=Parasteatoda tepidariorum TaxID=114398 RepID=UPI0039BCD270